VSFYESLQVPLLVVPRVLLQVLLRVLPAELDAHEPTCPFRPVSCVDIACNAKVSFCKMIDHMAKDHEAGDFVNANGSRYSSYFIVNDDDFNREIMWISDHLTLDTLHFFRECCRTSEGQWHVWIYLLGTPAEAAEFKACIKIVSPDTVSMLSVQNLSSKMNDLMYVKGEEMIYRGKVNALNSPTREKPSEVRGLTFPDFVARQFWKNKQIHYEVEVERRTSKKEESAGTPPPSTARSKSGKEEKRKKRTGGSSAPPHAGSSGEAEGKGGEGQQGKKEDVKETSC